MRDVFFRLLVTAFFVAVVIREAWLPGLAILGALWVVRSDIQLRADAENQKLLQRIVPLLVKSLERGLEPVAPAPVKAEPQTKLIVTAPPATREGAERALAIQDADRHCCPHCLDPVDPDCVILAHSINWICECCGAPVLIPGRDTEIHNVKPDSHGNVLCPSCRGETSSSTRVDGPRS